MKGLAREHTCMTPGLGQLCGDGLREEGSGGWEEVGNEGKTGDNCHSVNN